MAKRKSQKRRKRLDRRKELPASAYRDSPETRRRRRRILASKVISQAHMMSHPRELEGFPHREDTRRQPAEVSTIPVDREYFDHLRAAIWHAPDLRYEKCKRKKRAERQRVMARKGRGLAVRKRGPQKEKCR